MKKETDRLIVKKAHIFYSQVPVEEEIVDSCKNTGENTTKLDVVAKAKLLGEIIVQLQKDKNILNSLVYLDIPIEQIVERNTTIEEVVAQLEELEQEAKKFIEATK